MKLAFALCLLLASSCLALLPKHPADLATMLARQQFAVRSMMSVPQGRDDSSLVNDCFNQYLDEQTNAIVSYNKQYTGCLVTAEESRIQITDESASERQALLDRTNNMCNSLTACDQRRDGLDFFDCYSNASTDSYKVMFTLNSDSSQDYNRINAAYAQVETVLTACVDDARVDYAHKMDTCDENLTICLNADAPVTNAPTDAPTDAPTNAPVTNAPTDAPTSGPTNAPTDVPVTNAPTDAPTNAPTDVPVTNAPTDAPTDAPTNAPTDAPVTNAPTTERP
ncbi:hypothetical protein KR018_004649, partial [Drosophila ironensis]